MTTDQPTPTSSLEKARKVLLHHHDPQCMRCPTEYARAQDVARFEAAARAEVIREVEAMFEKYGKPDHGDWCSSIQAWNPRNRICDCGLDDAVRALSEGGEG